MSRVGTRGTYIMAICAMVIVIAIAIITWPDDSHRGNEAKPPYPPSPVIEGVTWDFDNMVRRAPGSDLWPVTWGPDNNIYVSWGDGGGFGGSNRKGRVTMGFARIEGKPPGFNAININGGANPENPASWKCAYCGKTGTLLFVDGTLYTWVNIQNGDPPDTVLWWSDDMGVTWQSAKWKFEGGGKFEPRAFVNYGPDYAGARDDYVYIYGRDRGYVYGRDRGSFPLVFLARTPRDRITDRLAYEFYAGTDDNRNPVWNTDISARKAVFTDPNGVNYIAAIYSPSLNRYLMSLHHGDYIGRFGIFDAPEPWGPWTTVAYYNNWAGLGDDIGGMPKSFPGKWISTDGTEMYAIFSGSDEWDSFNLVKVNLKLREKQEQTEKR